MNQQQAMAHVLWRVLCVVVGGLVPPVVFAASMTPRDWGFILTVLPAGFAGAVIGVAAARILTMGIFSGGWAVAGLLVGIAVAAIIGGLLATYALGPALPPSSDDGLLYLTFAAIGAQFAVGSAVLAGLGWHLVQRALLAGPV